MDLIVTNQLLQFSKYGYGDVGVNVRSTEILFRFGSPDDGRPGSPRAMRKNDSLNARYKVFMTYIYN
uniref:Omp85 domain-containing protein n=1 Tax=Heterorhabditis bacteriophora TaxID=37862 RepID=A0A1I7XQM0_HETBA